VSMREKWRLFRREREDPVPFYSLLAQEAATDLDRRHGPLRGQRLLDLGCGPGFYTAALRATGAEVIPVDNSEEELTLAGQPPAGALIADAGALPLEDGSVDGVFCSNLLEHTPDAEPVIAEIERVLAPGGWAYVSWTNWYSPWGGHDMTPYQYLGPTLGPKLYERRHGPPPKNGYGDGLWACHIGATLRLVRSRPGLEIEHVEPRYWPWAAPVCRLPGLREVVTWNCVIRLRRVDPAATPSDPASASAPREGDIADNIRRESPPRGADEREAAVAAARDVEGWMTEGQLGRLWDAVTAAGPGPAVVEIGSFRGRSAIVLALAAGDGGHVVAIDPHAGSDRGPGEIAGDDGRGAADHATFHANLARADVADRVEHVRAFSGAAHGEVAGPIDVLHVDGAHRYAPARDDIASWGARVRPGGRMLIHDAFSSVGVTLAQLRLLAVAGGWSYVGRDGSLAEYVRADLIVRERAANTARQLAQLPWFARNLAVKVALTLRLRPLARALGADGWPY